MSLLIAPWLLLGVTGPVSAQCPALPLGGSQRTAPFACRFDPILTWLFTPGNVPKDAYRVWVTDAPVDQVVRAFKPGAPPPDTQGAWVLRRMDPLDAYGTAGPYDRAKLARLYVGVRPRVTHGPIVERGHTVASIMLVSPYPNASLSRLEAGTLIMEFRMPPGVAPQTTTGKSH